MAPLRLEFLTAPLVAPFLPARNQNAHKGDFGHVLVVAGGPGTPGAGLLAAHGALRAGAGRVTYALRAESAQHIDLSQLPEVMWAPLTTPNLESELRAVCAQKNALVIGPGLGLDATAVTMLHTALTTTTVPTVLDADALTLIAQEPVLLTHYSQRLILTPHVGEMARLTQLSPDHIQAHRSETASQFAQDHGCIVVLKGAQTVIADPGGSVFVNTSGNPGMATAGMGDVLAGVIAGLLAQGLTPLNAAQLGVFVHGLAGDLVSARQGEAGMIASDVANEIPLAIRAVQLAGGQP